jgi:hypothetical protein
VNNINLADMAVSPMLDVIHYFFDEDFRYGSVDGAHSHGAFREQIYGNLYDLEYKYSTNPEKSWSRTQKAEDGTEVKPFIPPTDFDADSINPFGSVLDAPIG